MALSFQPLAPWHWVVTCLALAFLGMLLARGFKDRWRTLGRLTGTRVAVALLSVLAAGCLVVAAWNPIQVEEPATERVHLVMVLDVSDSVLRAEGGWQKLRPQLAKRLGESIRAMPAARRKLATADLMTFRDGQALAAGNLPLERLPRAISALDQAGFAAGDGSNLDGALRAAVARIESSGGAGAVLLVSDGNETRGDGVAAAEELAGRGIPVHVFPVESGFPSLAITAADLPRQVASRTQTHVRGVMRNSRDEGVGAQLSVARNPKLRGLGDHFGRSLALQEQVEIEEWARLRQPVVFDGFGLQFVDLALGDGGGGEHRRRFFTHVNRPPRVLALGGDFRWTAAIEPNAATIVQASPEELPNTYNVRDFDAVVISAVPAQRFAAGVLGAIAAAVREKGIGLFFLNGDHAGQHDEKPTVMMSYKETELAALLPVFPGPRPFTPDPPPRQIVMLVDTSGSMGGQRLNKAKQICSYIIERLLRPKDTLDLLTFTTNVGHLVKRRHMDAAGKNFALSQVAGMKAGGGTDPKEALKLIAHRRMTDCGLIFISDGQFSDISYRPDCRATVFAIGYSEVPRSSPLWKLADPFPVNDSFNPSRIRIPFFQPKPRKKFYERERFTALRIERFLRAEEAIPMPKDIPVPGSAVSHIKAEADLVGVRPKIADPLLAFMDVGQGRTGVFTSGFHGPWVNRASGRAAMNRWLREIISYTARDRYDFKLRDHGEMIDMEIALVSKGGVLPAVDQITVNLAVEGGATTGVLLRADPVVPGLFRGQARPKRFPFTQRAFLRLREIGPDALPRIQLIPMLIPPEGLIGGALKGESYSYGINEAVLAGIAAAGGGAYDPAPEQPFFRRRAPASVGRPLRRLTVLVGFILYLLAFAIRRIDP